MATALEESQVAAATPVPEDVAPGTPLAVSGTARGVECRFCGTLRPLASGRVHGLHFECQTCSSSQRVIRRNLGELPSEMRNFTKNETHAFFREMHRQKEENKRLDWQTVRATLVTSITTRTVNTFKAELEGKFLPMSVWLAQGWEQHVIERCPSEFSEELQVQTYAPSIKIMSWSLTHARVTEKFLKHEQDAQKKRQAKKKTSAKTEPGSSEEGELDVPAASSAGKDGKSKADEEPSKKEKQRQAREDKRNALENLKKAACAAKALPVLQAATTALERVLQKVKLADLTAEVRETVTSQQEKLRCWAHSARTTLQLQEKYKEQGSAEALPDLNFDTAAVKVLQKQVAETAKALRPQPKAKAKSAAAEPAAEVKRRKLGKQTARN